MREMARPILAGILLIIIGTGTGTYLFFTYSAVGTVKLLITDPPIYGASGATYDPSIQGIFVTFTKIEIHAAAAGGDSGWYSLTVGSKTIDLIKVLSVSQLLGSARLPTGKYDMIRMFASTARVVIDGRNVVYDIPSGGQTGLKAPIVPGRFMLTLGQTVNVLLTFSFNNHEILANGRNLVPVVKAEVQ